MIAKHELRRMLKDRRRQLTPQEQKQAEAAVFSQLTGFEPLNIAQTVMAYIACRGELSLQTAIEHLLMEGKTLLLPRCDEPGIMTARRVRSMKELVPGAYGLLEPAIDSEIMPPACIDLVLAPGVAFDLDGGRLGQGGGYYDRFLERTQALRVGVCHDFALLDHVPQEAHDLLMDFILTPQAMIACKSKTSDNRRA